MRHDLLLSDISGRAQVEDAWFRPEAWHLMLACLLVVLVGVAWAFVQEHIAGPKRDSLNAPDSRGKRSHRGEVDSHTTALREVRTSPPSARSTQPVRRPGPRIDDLCKVRGIGPKIAALLQVNGISTFQQLAETEVAHLRALLERARYYVVDPASWPAQARKLATGD